LGVITNAPGGNQLMTAGTAADNGGTLAAQYDAAGNTTALTVNRTKACFKGQTCNQVAYTYTWDEIGHLANASRSDNGAPPTSLDYRYDAGGGRVTTARIASQGIFLDRRFNVEIFGSLRLNGAKFDGTDYERTASTEAVYLMAGGSSLARLVYATADSPAQASGTLHVFFEIGDMLGSTSFVLDKDTSEVVEKRTYQAYGGVESEYQPDKWKGFREEYGFTGKELDLEVGLTYFGARYYSAELGRFLSADPLAVHALGADLNPYAYVGGHVATHTDPLGLADKPEPVVDNSGGSANTSPHYDTAQQVDDAYNGDVSAYCDASGCTPVSEEVVFGAAATPPEPPTAPPPGDTGGSSNVMDDSRGFVSFLDHHQREIGIGLIVVGVVLIGVATFGVGLIGIAGAGAAAAAGGGGVVATEVAVGTTIAVVEAEGAAAGVTVLAEVGGAAAEGAEVVSTGAEIAASRGPQATLELALKVQGTTPLSAQTVALLETAEGPTLVGAGEADLTAAQIAVAEQQGLTVTSLEGFHAEQTVINAAGEMGLKPTVGVATNSVCAARCGSLITEIGGWVKGKFFGF
jgi:RHS repeat-associated protein